MLNRFFCLAFLLLTTSSAWASFAPEPDAYDPLGGRIIKHSVPIVPHYFDTGSQYKKAETQRLARERNLGTTFYGWDGDTLAWETANETSTHYFYEPDSFVPLAQGVQNHAIHLHKTPDWTDRDYKVRTCFRNWHKKCFDRR